MHPPATRPAPATPLARELGLGQQALWFFQQLAPDSSAYNVSGAMNLHFPVDVAGMTSAVQATVTGHSMLNCVFRLTGGEVRRHRRTVGADPLLEVYELDADDQAVRALAQELAQRPFRLDREPPVRFALLRRCPHYPPTSPEAVGSPDILLMAAHHIAVDNVSQLLILRNVIAAYAAGSTATGPAGGDTGQDFDEFVRRERGYLDSPRAAAARTHWRGELRHAAGAVDLPTDLPRPAVYRFAGSEVDFPIPADVMAAVERAAAARNTTAFVYLLSAFQLLLYAYSGQTEFLLGYPVTLRPDRFRESIGYFVNTLPLHARVDPDGPFGNLLQWTGRKVLRGLMHRDYPFALMPRLLDTKRAPDKAGLISTMFVMTAQHPVQPLSAFLVPGTSIEFAGLTVSEFYLPQQQGQFDLTLQVFHHPAGARAQLKYNTSLFTPETARALAGGYVDVLREAAGGTLPERLRDVRVASPRAGSSMKERD
jgi:hypothetical protein